VLFAHQTPLHWIILALSVLLIGSLLKILLMARGRTALTRQLKESTRRLKELNSDYSALKTEHDQLREFQRSLEYAESAAASQPVKSLVQGRKGYGVMPEKYRYIRSLSEKGMDAREIASILAISRQEAEQLVTLSKIAREGTYLDIVGKI